MRRMQRSKGWMAMGIVCLLSPLGLRRALADAKSDVSISSNKTCDNGSSLYEIANANATSGLIATVTQTIVVSGKTIVSSPQISLAPSEKKTLGCALQDPPPATNVQFAWQVESAQYK
jgi:hypothetical protein